MATKQEISEHIGTILKNSPELHNLEYEVGFSIYVNTFVKRMVSDKLFDSEKGVRIHSDDFYKGSVFLDYFCDVIEGNYMVRDNLVTISKKLRELEKKEKIDKGISYLNLESVIGEVGLYAKEHDADYYTQASTLKQIIERYAREHKPLEPSQSIKADPYYEALGLMIYDMVSDENKHLLVDTSCRVELKALVFADSIAGYLKKKENAAQINTILGQKEFLKASLGAIEFLAQEITMEEAYSNIQNYFNERMNDGSKKTHA
jgi:hypothetical protein